MTVSSSNNKNTYVGNASTTVFSYTFRILDETHILVQEKVDATGVITTKTLTTHYTISGVDASSGGNVTMVTAPATGVTLIITRNMPLTQDTDYTANDAFPAETHEQALDELTMSDQQQQEQLDRSLKFDPDVALEATLPDPSLSLDKYLKYNAAGDDFEAVTLSTTAGLGNIVEDTSPQLGGQLGTNSFQINLSKGADVASAAALTVGTDGNYFDVTGTTTVTSIATLGIGTVISLHFDGIVTLTHHATDLILPSAANITTAAGDEFTFVEYAAGDWRCIGYSLASGISLAAAAIAISDLAAGTDGELITWDSAGVATTVPVGTAAQVLTSNGVGAEPTFQTPAAVGKVKQIVYTNSTTSTSTTASIPDDTSIPQNTEGTEYITVTITPTATDSTLVIEFNCLVDVGGSTDTGVVALFQDSTANALGATLLFGTSEHTVHFRHIMAAGTTSSTTFKIRLGSQGANSLWINRSAVVDPFSTVGIASLTVLEVGA